jgi:serine/threonine protein kinase/Tol biopolymer transport system component
MLRACSSSLTAIWGHASNWFRYNPPKLPLVPGLTLGPYKILAPLGSGGMGEVYKAIDSRLDRLVAIKVLPQAPEAWSTQAIERFRREARAASALNHPHICTIHDIGEAANPEAPGGEPVRFIVMELLDGETLQQRLSRGSLDVRSLIDWGGALVDALAAAHATGIIHRDIKPANIFVTAHGPKILDFGLAKTVPAVATGAVSDNTVSVVPPVTDPGSAVGTVAYMSPEQLRGDALDPRSDLFSFGLVLYEMATGRQAFGGGTAAVIAASILHDEPVPPCHHQSDLPPRLEELVLKLLEKDRDLRYQTAAELRTDLRRLGRDLQLHATPWAGTPVAPAAMHSQVPIERAAKSPHAALDAPSSKTALGGLGMAVLATAAVVAAGGYFLMQWRNAGGPAGATPALEDLQILQLTTTGNALRPAISGDGRYVAYVQQDGNDFSLWIRQVATSSNVRIVPAEPRMRIVGVTVTPDGSFVDFVRGDSPVTTALWRVPFLGGKPTRIVDRITSPVSWSADGKQMAFVRADLVRRSYELVIADADGSRERVLAERQRPQRFNTLLDDGAPSLPPAWSLDGRTIAMPGDDVSAKTAHIVFVNTATGAEQTVPTGEVGLLVTGLSWLDDETLLLGHGTGGAPVQLWRVTYPGGQRTRLTNDVNTYNGVSLTTDRGGVVTTRSERRGSLWVGDGSAGSGAEVVPPFRVGRSFMVGWAADRVLYTTFSGVFPAVWKTRPGDRTVEEVVQQAEQPLASPDGASVVFRSTEQGSRAGLWRVDADGGRATQVVAGDARYAVITNDGRLIFQSQRSGVESLWIVPIGGGEPTAITRTSGARPSVSPDGKTIAFLSLSDQNKSELVVCDLPACSARRTLPTSNNHPKWTPDGRGLAFVDPATQSNIVVQPLDGGPRRPLTRFTAGTIADFNWSHDGKHLAVAHVVVTNDIVLLKGLKP